MNYCTATYYLLFLPICVLGYQVVPRRLRKWLLLAASAAFYANLSRKRIVFILLSTLLIYVLGLWMARLQNQRNSRMEGLKRQEKKPIREACRRKTLRIAWLGAVILIGVLLTVKYSGFFVSNLNQLMRAVGSTGKLKAPAFRQPLGISFYTMSAISYLVDVYNEKIKADRNYFRLLLFLMFFPCVMEGPILRYSDITETMWEGPAVQWKSLCFGSQRILYGLMKKFLVADRLNILVKTVFLDYAKYDGGVIVLGMVCYTIQLYCEFSGTMDVVIGSGEIFGLTIPENFRRPFFSKNISEFWTRWHISLGSWFRDYIFYPVSLTTGMKRLTNASRKKIGPYYGPALVSAIALFCVWFSNGLWHGSDWNYLFFGMYHLFFILLESLLEPPSRVLSEKMHIDRSGRAFTAFRIIRTILIVNVGELFFRAHGLRAGFIMFEKMVTQFTAASLNLQTIRSLGLDGKDLIVAAAGVLFVLFISVLQEKGMHIRETVAAKPLPVRWACYYGLILAVLIFGAYGMNYIPVDPIYAGF